MAATEGGGGPIGGARHPPRARRTEFREPEAYRVTRAGNPGQPAPLAPRCRVRRGRVLRPGPGRGADRRVPSPVDRYRTRRDLMTTTTLRMLATFLILAGLASLMNLLPS